MDELKQRPDYWFKAKRYGWGWGLPARWQGWVVLLLYAVVMTCAGLVGERVQSPAGPLIAAVLVVAATSALVFVCWRKGEPPQWRWGNRRGR